MPRNSNGVYSIPEALFIPGTVIENSPVNSDLSDIATTLTQSLATTGVSVMTGQLKASSTGTASVPSIVFSASVNTGLYLAAPNQIGWSANEAIGALFNANRTVTWNNSATWVGSGLFTGSLVCNQLIAAVSSFIGGNPITNYPQTTQTVFRQLAAPLGWTRNTNAANDDRAFRVTNSTIGSGGVVGFNTVFGATVTGNATLTTVTMPGHNHFFQYNVGFFPTGAEPCLLSIQTSGGDVGVTSTSTGGGGAHLHTFDLRVLYMDLMLATKD